MKLRDLNWPFLLGAALLVAIVIGGSIAASESGLWMFLP